MSTPEPANGTFFVDPARPVLPATPEAAPPATEPVADAPPALPPAGRSAAEQSAQMLDVPLGTLIFRAGLLAEEQLEDALHEGMRTGKRLGEVLIERGWLKERDLGRLLAGQKGLPFVDVSASDVQRAALETLPEEKAKLLVALPLRHEDGRLVVAVADPSNELMLENLRRALGTAPRLVVAPYPDLVRAIGEAYASAPPEAPATPEPEVAQPVTPLAEAHPEPQPEWKPEPQPEGRLAPTVEQAPAEPTPTLTPPAARPLPIVMRPAEKRAKVPAPEWLEPPSPSQPSAAVEDTPQVDAPATEAIEAEPPTPIDQQSGPEPEPVAEAAATARPEREARPAQAPPAPELFLEWPMAPRPASEVPAELPAGPASPVEESDPETRAQEEPGPLSAVVLRLRAGERLEVGTFRTAAEAAARAEEVVAEIAAAEGSLMWPFVAQRYLRPDSIVSVDLIAERSDD
jgi:hypothetical protein